MGVAVGVGLAVGVGVAVGVTVGVAVGVGDVVRRDAIALGRLTAVTDPIELGR